MRWGSQWLTDHEFSERCVDRHWQRLQRIAPQVIEGRVLRANERGILLKGRDRWLNYSKYADAYDIERPAPGAEVRCRLDKAGYIRSVFVTERGASDE